MRPDLLEAQACVDWPMSQLADLSKRLEEWLARGVLRAMGIRDKPIAPASPWQNGFAERLIGSVTSVSIMSSSGAKRICVGFCDRTQCTTIKSGHIGLWTKMRRSGGQFSGPESSLQIRSLADFITNTSESRFSVHTGPPYRRSDDCDFRF
jgi:hypothetical protein